MKAILVGTVDSLTSTLCAVGPLRFVGSWWWRRRLSTVHSRLGMEHYESRN